MLNASSQWPLIAFLVFEFFFGIVWVSYATDQLLVMKGQTSPRRLMAWLGLTWLCLLYGAWLAAWGTFFASPLQPSQNLSPRRSRLDDGEMDDESSKRYQDGRASVSSSSYLREKSTHLLHRIKAPILNTVLVCVPLVHLLVTAIFTAMAQGDWMVSVL